MKRSEFAEEDAEQTVAPSMARIARLYETERYAGIHAAIRDFIPLLRDQAAQMPSQDLAWLIRYAQRSASGVDTISDLLAALRQEAHRRPELAECWRAARRRLKFSANTRSRRLGSASLISLGLNCLPWQVPNLWGLRDPDQIGALDSPFALSSHRLRHVMKVLAEDFEAYADGPLRKIETPGGGHLATSPDGGVVFTHHKGDNWMYDDCAALRRSLTAKIEAFRIACRRPDAVFLINKILIDYPATQPAFLPQLNAALERHTGVAKNRIIISNPSPDVGSASQHQVDDHTVFLFCPMPRADYVWHDAATSETAEGLEFEFGYVSAIRRALLDWGLLRRVSGAGAG